MRKAPRVIYCRDFREMFSPYCTSFKGEIKISKGEKDFLFDIIKAIGRHSPGRGNNSIKLCCDMVLGASLQQAQSAAGVGLGLITRGLCGMVGSTRWVAMPVRLVRKGA